jgi:hypothetical protein
VNSGVCVECGAVIPRSRPKSEYCSKQCSLRARDRARYEADPERERERSRSYYRRNREAVLARAAAKRNGGREPVERHCSECGAVLVGRQRVVCSSRCGEARFKRLRPEAYAAREAAKVVRRRERRRAGGS